MKENIFEIINKEAKYEETSPTSFNIKKRNLINLRKVMGRRGITNRSKLVDQLIENYIKSDK